MYKNNSSILGLNKGRDKFTSSEFPTENPRSKKTKLFLYKTGRGY